MRHKKRAQEKNHSYKGRRNAHEALNASFTDALRSALEAPDLIARLKAQLQAIGGAPELEALLAMAQTLGSVQEVPLVRKKDIDGFMKEQGSRLAQMLHLHGAALSPSSFNARILTFSRKDSPDNKWELSDILFAQPEAVAWELQTLNAQMDDVLAGASEGSMSVWLACAQESSRIYCAYVRQLGQEPLLFLIKGGRQAHHCLQGEMVAPYLEQMLAPSRRVKARWEQFLFEQCERLTASGQDSLEQALKDCDAPAAVLKSLPLLSRVFYSPQALSPLVRETVSCFASQGVIEAHLLLATALDLLEQQHSEMKAKESELLKDFEKKTKKLRDSLERVEMVTEGLRKRSAMLEQDLAQAKRQLERPAKDLGPQAQPMQVTRSIQRESLGAVLDRMF